MKRQAKLFEKKILLYGAGEMANRVRNTLMKCDMTVEGYIDKRYKSYEESGYNERKVFSLDETADFLDKDEYVVIVTVKNAYIHNEIAQQLKNIGFSFVIFKPLDILNGNNYDKNLDIIMTQNCDITDGYTCDNWDLIDISNINFTTYHEHSVYNKKQGKVFTYVPAELIFYKLESCSSMLEAAMLANRTAVRMYEEFERGNLVNDNRGLLSYIDEARSASIINDMVVDDEWEKLFIAGKLSVYHNMDRQFALNPEFFKNSTANVILHKPTFFEINSTAKNRVSFLMAKGNKFIPVSMDEKDYIVYRNEDVLKEVAKKLDGKKMLFPISHPYFMERETEADDYVRRWIIPIVRYLFDKIEYRRHIKNLFVTECCDDWGITYRYLKLLGINVKSLSCDDITESLNRLFYSDEQEEKRIEENPSEILIYSNRGDADIDVGQLITENTKLMFIQLWEDNNFMWNISDAFVSKPFFSTIWGNTMVSGYIYERKE